MSRYKDTQPQTAIPSRNFSVLLIKMTSTKQSYTKSRNRFQERRRREIKGGWLWSNNSIQNQGIGSKQEEEEG